MKKQICKNCTFYTAFYKQWAGSYGRLNNGYCAKHDKPQIQFETCNIFQNNEQKERRREKVRLEYLEHALKAIIEIAQILQEKENEK